MIQPSFDPASEPYVNLATLRKNGTEVKTPVWVAEVAGRYYVFSAGEAGKVKRIRANGRARLAACNFKGDVHSEWMDAQARLVDGSETQLIDAIYHSLRKKYGWQIGVLNFFAKISGKYNKRALIEITLIEKTPTTNSDAMAEAH